MEPKKENLKVALMGTKSALRTVLMTVELMVGKTVELMAELMADKKVGETVDLKVVHLVAH